MFFGPSMTFFGMLHSIPLRVPFTGFSGPYVLVGRLSSVSWPVGLRTPFPAPFGDVFPACAAAAVLPPADMLVAPPGGNGA